jgi:hypothetical protein
MQPFKARGVLDDEFLELELICRLRTNTNAETSKGMGVDPNATEARAAPNQQALQGRTPGNHAMQRGLRHDDVHKSELLKLREVKRMGSRVREVAFSHGGEA